MLPPGLAWADVESALRLVDEDGIKTIFKDPERCRNMVMLEVDDIAPEICGAAIPLALSRLRPAVECILDTEDKYKGLLRWPDLERDFLLRARKHTTEQAVSSLMDGEDKLKYIHQLREAIGNTSLFVTNWFDEASGDASASLFTSMLIRVRLPSPLHASLGTELTFVPSSNLSLIHI